MLNKKNQHLNSGPTIISQTSSPLKFKMKANVHEDDKEMEKKPSKQTQDHGLSNQPSKSVKPDLQDYGQNRNEPPIQNTSEMQINLFDKSTDTGGFFSGPTTKEAEKEHYNFLNEMSHRFNVDKEKIINLEARISCNERKKVTELLIKNQMDNIKAQYKLNGANLNIPHDDQSENLARESPSCPDQLENSMSKIKNSFDNLKPMKAKHQSKLVISPQQNSIYFERSQDQNNNNSALGLTTNEHLAGGPGSSSQNSLSTDNNNTNNLQGATNKGNMNENTIQSSTSKSRKKRDRKPDKTTKKSNSKLQFGDNLAKDLVLNNDEPHNLKRSRHQVDNRGSATKTNLQSPTANYSNKSDQKSQKSVTKEEIEIQIKTHAEDSSPDKFSKNSDGSIVSQACQNSSQKKGVNEENDQLKQELENLKQQLRGKEIENEKNAQLFNMFDQKMKEVQQVIEQNNSQKRQYVQALHKYLINLENQNKKEKRIWLNEQSIRLGRLQTQRQGARVAEIWEEGEAFRKINCRLREIAIEKDEIEKLKKSRKNGKGSNTHKTKLPMVPDAFGVLNEQSEFDLEESEFNNIDKNEQKEIYLFKLKMSENEERRLKDELHLLEKEKVLFQQEFKRTRDEEFSKYCGIHCKSQFTVLKDRYLILSILGKGGYSEVYKAYDLENCREVACKIHHFDNSWSEQIKDNYIKHAIRENEIHKDLNHRRVVKQFDTVEIDHNSFCTILELCSGPDLYFYLKQNRQIPEKEAKLIISQILSGLKYLNESKQKIIHYDLKPQNIIFHLGEVKITDFGLCKTIDEGVEKIELTSQGVGTYWYQAPECFNQDCPQITHKVDIWSVGVIFFELIFGAKPFGNNQSQQSILKDQTILNARQVVFPAKPPITDSCKEFIRNCLAYHHQDRYDVYEAYYSPYLRGMQNLQQNQQQILHLQQQHQSNTNTANTVQSCEQTPNTLGSMNPSGNALSPAQIQIQNMQQSIKQNFKNCQTLAQSSIF